MSRCVYSRTSFCWGFGNIGVLEAGIPRERFVEAAASPGRAGGRLEMSYGMIVPVRRTDLSDELRSCVPRGMNGGGRSGFIAAIVVVDQQDIFGQHGTGDDFRLWCTVGEDHHLGRTVLDSQELFIEAAIIRYT